MTEIWHQDGQNDRDTIAEAIEFLREQYEAAIAMKSANGRK